MPATLTTVNSILKEVYGKRMPNLVQDELIAIKRIEQTSDGVTETVGGKYVDFPVRVSRNSGIGYRAEGGALPVAGQQGYAEVHVPLKYGYGRFRISGQAMQLAEKDHQAFASALDREMNFLKSDLAKDSARVAYGDGTGLLASINDTATSVTHAVLDTQYLEVGQVVDVVVRSTGATSTGILNTSITAISGLNVTFAGSFTGITTLGVYRQGNWGNEPAGFASIIDDTSVLHTLDPASTPKWAATVNGNSGTDRALSEGLMIETCDDVRQQGGKVTAIFTSLGVRRSYFNLLSQQRRYTDTKEFAGGFTGLAFNYGREIPVVEDVDAPKEKMWCVGEESCKVYRTKDWHVADDDGNTMKWVTDYDTWEGFYRKYWEIGTEARNHHAVIEDIIEG